MQARIVGAAQFVVLGECTLWELSVKKSYHVDKMQQQQLGKACQIIIKIGLGLFHSG